MNVTKYHLKLVTDHTKSGHRRTTYALNHDFSLPLALQLVPFGTFFVNDRKVKCEILSSLSLIVLFFSGVKCSVSSEKVSKN